MVLTRLDLDRLSDDMCCPHFCLFFFHQIFCSEPEPRRETGPDRAGPDRAMLYLLQVRRFRRQDQPAGPAGSTGSGVLAGGGGASLEDHLQRLAASCRPGRIGTGRVGTGRLGPAQQSQETLQHPGAGRVRSEPHHFLLQDERRSVPRCVQEHLVLWDGLLQRHPPERRSITAAPPANHGHTHCSANHSPALSMELRQREGVLQGFPFVILFFLLLLQRLGLRPTQPSASRTRTRTSHRAGCSQSAACLSL